MPDIFFNAPCPKARGIFVSRMRETFGARSVQPPPLTGEGKGWGRMRFVPQLTHYQDTMGYISSAGLRLLNWNN